MAKGTKEYRYKLMHREYEDILNMVYAVENDNEMHLLDDIAQHTVDLANHYYNARQYYTVVRLIHRVARYDYPHIAKQDMERLLIQAQRQYEENVGIGYDRILIVLSQKVDIARRRLWGED